MAKCIVSSSILVALRLILNISVKFLSEETSYCADMGPAHWTTSSISAGRAAFLPRSFDVCIKIVHLVAVKRNSGSTGIEHPRYCRRSLVVLLLLLCSFSLSVQTLNGTRKFYSVFSLSALFLWSALPGCVVPGPALWADSSGSYTTRDLEIILLS